VKIGHHTHPRRNIVNDIRWIGENGFDFVDLFLEPESDAAHIDTGKISDALGQFGLSAVGHTAWYLPVGSEMRELRENAVDILKRYVLICAELKCALMTVHANWPSGLFNAEEGVNFQTESFQSLCPFAADNGVTIIYESVATPKDNKENIRKILDLNPLLDFHADIGHLNLSGRNPIEYLTTFKDRLRHVHLHDNDGLRDLHLPMGTGIIDWDALIKELKSFYDGTITLEIFSNDKDYVLLTKRKLREKWDNSGSVRSSQ